MLIYEGISTSFAFGIFVLVFYVIFSGLINGYGVKIKLLLMILFLNILILSHFLLSHFLFGYGNISQIGFYLAYLIFYMLGTYFLAITLLSIPNSELNIFILFTLYILLLIGGLSIYGLNLPTPINWNKPVGLFIEPSHYAVALAPFLLYGVIKFTRNSTLFLLFLVAIYFLALENVTLLMCIFLCILITINLKKSLYIIPFVLTIIYYKIEYILPRIVFYNIDNLNLSGLVYMQGIEFIVHSIKDTFFWGIGFQNTADLGGLNNNVSSALRAVNNGFDANLNDSGFLISKIITEFGLFGLFFVLFYINEVKKSFLYLRLAFKNNKYYNNIDIFINSIIFSSILEFLFKSNGYFTPTIFLLLTSFFINKLNYKKLAR